MKIFLTILTYIIPILFGYLMGSVLYGKHIAKKKNIDITAVGSMNSGGTNVGRTVGKWFGILTMVLDALKCYISCLVVFLILSFVKLDIYTYPKMIELVVCLTGLSCAFGHAYPIFDHFKDVLNGVLFCWFWSLHVPSYIPFWTHSLHHSC